MTLRCGFQVHNVTKIPQGIVGPSHTGRESARKRGDRMIRTLAAALATSTCIVAFATPAAAQTREYDIRAGSLKSALDAYVRQSGRQLVYRADQVRSARSPGVRGHYSAEAALAALLAGSGFETRIDGNLVAIVRSPGNGQGDGEASSSNGAGAGSSTGPEERTEIVVTAQKREERLMDVPVPVTALSAENLVATGQRRLEDYFSRVPGLSLTLSGNASVPVVAIRGVITAPSNPTVGIVIDDVPFGRSSSEGFFSSYPDVDPADLERIEVLRGPQGTLYGPSSIGGLLKYVTRPPRLGISSANLRLGVSAVRYGDVGYDVHAAVNLPIGDDAAVRVSGYRLREPGFVDNSESGERDIDARLAHGGLVSLFWRLGSDWSIRLNAMGQDSDRRGSSDFDPALGSSPQRPFLAGTGVYERRSRSLTGTINGRIGPVEVTSVTGYNTDEYSDNFDSTVFNGGLSQLFFGVPRAVTNAIDETRKFTQEIRANVNFGDSVDLLLGGFYTHERSDGDVEITANDTAETPVGLLLRNISPLTFEDIAAFGTLTFTITPSIDIQVGGRASRNNIRLVRYSVPFGGSPLGTEPGFLNTTESSDNAFTYLVAPRWRISPDAMLYGRLSSGYRPGGPNFNCGVLPTVPCSYGDDSTVNAEVGFKGDIVDRYLSVDVSLFNIDWKNIQIAGLLAAPVPGIPATFVTYTGNAGRARSRGFELSVESRPWPGAELTGWITYTDAKLRSDLMSFGSLTGVSGDRLPFSSRWSSHASFDQRLDLGDELAARFGMSLTHVGERLGAFLAPPATRFVLPSYVQVDLQARLDFRNFGLSFYLNNVTDERGILHPRLFDGVTGPTLVNTIRPRTFGVALDAAF